MNENLDEIIIGYTGYKDQILIEKKSVSIS